MARLTIRAFVNRNRITADAEYADRNPNIDPDEWSRTATHWRVELRRARRRMTVYFSQGSAHVGPPETVDVLDSLASDAATVANASSFEDWADELGYDADSRSAERTYRTIRRQSDRLAQFLGADLYSALLWDTDRL